MFSVIGLGRVLPHEMLDRAWCVPSRYGDSSSGTAAFVPLSSSACELVCGVLFMEMVPMFT